jgi:hypothetical protein
MVEEIATGKLLWVSPTTIHVNRLVEARQFPIRQNRQPCSCALCRTSHSDNGTLAANRLEADI